MAYKRKKNPFKKDRVKCCKCNRISTSYHLGESYCQLHNPKNQRKMKLEAKSEMRQKRIKLNKEFRKRYGDDWRKHLGRQLKKKPVVESFDSVV